MFSENGRHYLDPLLSGSDLMTQLQDIENPTVEGIAERMGIPRDILHTWLKQDAQFREELTRLKEFQEKDPYKEGTEFDYFIHSSGVQFILEETKKRYEGK